MGALLKRVDGKKTLYSLFMCAVGLMMVVPFIFMISASFKYTGDVFDKPLEIIPSRINWDNYPYLFNHKFFFTWYWNSIRVVLLTIVFRTFIVTMAAYTFARLDFRGKNWIFMVLLATIMIPGDLTIVARYLIYNYMNLIDTQWVIIIPAAFDVFFLFLLRQFFIVIPRELSEASMIDGCSHFKIYYRIMLPLAVPAIVTMIIFTFIWVWNDYVTPFIFITDINKQLITVGLQYFQGEAGPQYALQMAGASLAIIPTLLFFAFTQRYFVEGIVGSAVKG
ncbi:carbohydrate ABC transporter permease [Paenibacillus faecalis]|uniref:carbohydrate ABC transporter permease n=1 Tax=Paenibacillus faecalis TaxID=2079532 RepID=UPI00131A5A31|nr:carbohydrate ABC transporter permease [Paenibacillus faecalis]